MRRTLVALWRSANCYYVITDAPKASSLRVGDVSRAFSMQEPDFKKFANKAKMRSLNFLLSNIFQTVFRKTNISNMTYTIKSEIVFFK